MTIKETKIELHKEIMDYIDAIVTNMPNPDDNRTERAYALAFECAMSVFFGKEYVCNTKQSNKTLVNIYDRRLAKMEGDLFPAGYVDCLGIKSWSSFSMEERFTRIENKLGITKIYKDETCIPRIEHCEFNLDYIKVRLNALDADIFPTNKEISGMRPVITLEEQFRRLEDKLGVNNTYIKELFMNFVDRLGQIERANSAREWHCGSKNKMPYAKVKVPYVPKFKIGDTIIYLVNDCEYIIDAIRESTDGKPMYDYHRGLSLFSAKCDLVEDTFKLKETPYVCPILKHQHALQDALQDAFGEKTVVPKFATDNKKGIQPICKMGRFTLYQDTSDLPVLMPFKGKLPYVPRLKIGDKFADINLQVWEITGIGKAYDGYSTTYLLKGISSPWVTVEQYAETIDQICRPVIEEYIPKYKVGDILRMDYNPPYANYTFIEIVNIAHHISPIDGKSELYYECVNGQQLKCKGFDNNSLFELIWRKK